MLSVRFQVFRALHFINTPPALIVIRCVSMHLLNLERFLKGVGTTVKQFSPMAN